MADDLIAQIRAAIDEDERVARLAVQGPWHVGHVPGDDAWQISGTTGTHYVTRIRNNGTGASEHNARHIGRHDPDRALRQVEFHRKTLAQHDGIHRCDWGDYAGGEFQPCSALLDLAAVYRIADHG